MIRVTRIFALLLLTIALASCHTAQKYIESGDYDGAIDYCVQKVRGKKNKKTEYVRGLEVAFHHAQKRDLNTIDKLLAENRAENWERINSLYREIERRQNKVAPLIPLSAKDGYLAHFNMIDVARLESESREKAAEYLYAQAQSLLQKGERGDKKAAREAYYTLRDLEDRYFRHYKDIDELKKDARYYGTTHVLFEIKNQSNKILPREFNDRVLAISKRDLDSEWKSFHFEQESGLEFDYKVVYNVRKVDISPERVQERSYMEEKEIQDGWDYVLDARGNVKKDSAGNDIKTPRIVRIRANVLEAYQTKAARLSGSLEVFDTRRNSRLDAREVGAEILFEHYASTFQGDARALSDQSRSRIGCTPIPFPQDEDMLVQAADRIKPNLRDQLRSSGAIY